MEDEASAKLMSVLSGWAKNAPAAVEPAFSDPPPAAFNDFSLSELCLAHRMLSDSVENLVEAIDGQLKVLKQTVGEHDHKDLMRQFAVKVMHQRLDAEMTTNGHEAPATGDQRQVVTRALAITKELQ